MLRALILYCHGDGLGIQVKEQLLQSTVVCKRRPANQVVKLASNSVTGRSSKKLRTHIQISLVGKPDSQVQTSHALKVGLVLLWLKRRYLRLSVSSAEPLCVVTRTRGASSTLCTHTLVCTPQDSKSHPQGTDLQDPSAYRWTHPPHMEQVGRSQCLMTMTLRIAHRRLTYLSRAENMLLLVVAYQGR
jgi:hypothetical protein